MPVQVCVFGSSYVPSGSYFLCFLPGYRHEKPANDELAQQNIKDRYHGQNDPVAKRMLAGYAALRGLKPPEDTSIVGVLL